MRECRAQKIKNCWGKIRLPAFLDRNSCTNYHTLLLATFDINTKPRHASLSLCAVCIARKKITRDAAVFTLRKRTNRTWTHWYKASGWNTYIFGRYMKPKCSYGACLEKSACLEKKVRHFRRNQFELTRHAVYVQAKNVTIQNNFARYQLQELANTLSCSTWMNKT